MSPPGSWQSPACGHTVCILLLLFLGQFAQGQGPGYTKVEMTVVEESAAGMVVGTLPVRSGYTYRLQQATDLFELDGLGALRTKVRIDREALTSDVLDLYVEGIHPEQSLHPVDLTVTVLDINDNAPRFQETSSLVSFQEDAQNGQQQLLNSAVDPDKGRNGTILEYKIISGNEDGKFYLGQITNAIPFLFIITTGNLDRETKDRYWLNISAVDGGDVPKYGFMTLRIDITDVNDCPPTFDQSEYSVQINESADVGSVVLTAEASDKDIGENARILYSITDTTGQFAINQDTGIITTMTSPLRCTRNCGLTRTSADIPCDPNSCFFMIEARDRGRIPLQGRAYISVSIMDENDHDPIIAFQPAHLDPLTGFATIDENSSGDRVTSITVTDADQGVNGQTTVQIASGNEAVHFQLNTLRVSDKEVFYYIVARSSLDRETIPRYNLTVKAVDLGSPPRSSTAFLIITVNDANDHTPYFEKTEYRAVLSELALPGSYVAGVRALDEDSGQNSQLTYTIVSGDSQSWFSIDSSTGLVVTRTALDHELSPRIILNISARDSGATPFSNFTRLVIDIQDENDMAPLFRSPELTVEKDENQAASDIVTMTAVDDDSGLNGTVNYRFHADVTFLYPGVFQIDTSSGKVSSLMSFDHETISSYTLKVIAEDGGNPPLSSTATVHVRVRDVNDNNPEFLPSAYYINVFETDPASISVIRVVATDKDSGSNGRVTYSFSGIIINNFNIDPNTGVITTNTVLRRTVSGIYTLSVMATDGGGKRSTQDATVTVVVASIVDAAPVFTNPRYNFNIVEDFGMEAIKVGQVIGSVSVTGGSGITYFITDGDPYQVFSVDGQGGIRRSKLVDCEQRASYDLTVIASAGSKFGQTKVTVNVDDVNDNRPKFTAVTTETAVLENWPAGYNVFLAGAQDADSGDNARLLYSLVSADDPNGVFGISQTTGIISLQKKTSQLSKDVVRLTVRVRDYGLNPLNTTMDVLVRILDVNDHTPVFSRSFFRLPIPESMPVNEIIMTLMAMDTDTGRNRELQYNIVRGNEEGRFGIFPDGKLYVAHGLDRETRDMYSLMIQVKDNGESPRSSSTNVTVYVMDTNDNSPVFDNLTYGFTVPENSPSGTFVGTVRASDLDVGPNAELIYSLIEGNQNFSIDHITGALYTKRPFDREYVMETSSVEFYTVDVFATDNGSPKLRGKATVKVFISDVNDNPPVFAKALFSASIMENADSSTRVIKMTATDADTGANGNITYAITEGNQEDKFRIAQATGEITVVGPLDRETRDYYMLTVEAADRGVGQQLRATTQVSITVTDYNDNMPQFTSILRQLNVEETKPLGELLTTFTGRDLDQGNNAKMYFSIYSGNEDDVFNLDGYTGKLYLVRQLDYEQKRQYTLNVSVTDEGYHPSLSSYIFFAIYVLDANDNEPIFKDGFKVINVPEDTYDDVIVTLRATDEDSGDFGRVLYNIISQDPDDGMFRIVNDTGEIRVVRRLDRESQDFYRLAITVTDQAREPALRRTAQKSLTIIITDVNDNAPAFVSPPAFAVPAGAARGQAVATLLAKDADSGQNGEVSYSLLTQASPFSVNDLSGQISLQQILEPSRLTYTLHVRAVDRGDVGQNVRRTTDTTVTIVLAPNPGVSGPVFASGSYTASLSENDPANTSLLRLSASATRGEVTVNYYLTNVTTTPQGVACGGIFRVDQVTGVVINAAKLDREVLGDLFTLDITAMETGAGATSPRTRTIQATVRLTDVNDTPPRFSPSVYNVSHNEQQAADPSVVRVTYTDPDTTGQVTLRLSGVGSENFDIQPDGQSGGTIVTVAPLDREREDKYTLVVTANDGVNTTSATVTISISDANDNSPIFTKPFYSFDVNEDADISATVARVTALDADIGENGRVTYDFLTPWGSDLFQLDSVLGTFTLIGKLDYELRQLYVLKVVARDGGSPPRSSTTTVYMNVADVNDNQPEFDPASYSQTLAENVPVGSPVLNVSATDVDAGSNGEVRYSLVGDSNLHFMVDPVSGMIQTAAPLDRETQALHSLSVMATDQAASPADRLSATALVTVTLRDVNDNPPQFTSANSTAVKEETPNGTVVFTISVSDRDSGLNREVTFTLAPLPGLGYPFILDPRSGQLKVNTVLQREKTANYTLLVTATDGGSPPLSATQILFIKVEDVNNNAPRFTQSVYYLTVAEDASVGTSLLRVQALDSDEGVNGVVCYFIESGDLAYDLALDLASGVLRLQKPLDYERVTRYNLTVRAEDSGLERVLNSTATVLLTVTDVNDFQPVFDDSPYVAYVQEGMGQAAVDVLTVTARDEDSENNSRVAYQLRDLNQEIAGLFQIEPLTGRITALTALDREVKPKYVLTIIAIDSGTSPRLTGTGTLTVFVMDINDHAPVFTSSTTYVGHVTENGASSQSVITVTATDMDEGINAQISYSLEDTYGERFTVLSASGEIVATRPLDREQQAQYSLVVIATDQGIPPRSSTASVLVIVDDVNDYAPTFEQASYSVTIVDRANSGSFVVGVTALDRDAGNNGRVQYSILGDNSNSPFFINPQTGVVLTRQLLTAASYTFQVAASDTGVPRLNATVTVTVQVRPPSGTAPTFLDIPTSARVRENAPMGMVVASVRASSTESSSLQYRIVGGNVNSAFIINQDNGTIWVAMPIDYEVSSSLDVWLECREKGNAQAMAAYRNLTVLVEDENDNAPRFAASVYRASFMENQPLGTSVLQVQATDEDSGINSQIVFRLASGNSNNTFQINSSTGIITTRNPTVDREGIPFYRLVVEAVDQGVPKQTATVAVEIIILDLNDNRPSFSGLFSIAVPEDLPLNSLILIVTSTDNDTAPNANCTYQFLAGQDASFFAVDPLSGNITSIKQLDAETKEYYRPRVKVTDFVFATDTEVAIRLLDVNDNPPVFPSPSIVFEFREGQSPGARVGRLVASDRDISSPNNRFYFALRRPSTLFELDAETGVIVALRTMEYARVVLSSDGTSSANTYTLEVLVIDLGMPSLSSSATVTVAVTDANNHAPVFQHSDYVSAVPENAGEGTSILTVEANDYLDLGLNAEVSYSITGGNGSSLFRVEADSGVVAVRGSLSGQRDRNYVLTLQATDKGQPPQSGLANVVLSVTDVNRYAPEFRNSLFAKEVQEDVNVNYVVETMSANDRDLGLNGQYRFAISSGNELGLFAINPTSGQLVVAKALDYETRPVHVLNLTVYDLGLFSLASSRVYTVTLRDVNDNPPVFNQSLFTAFVRENATNGTIVTELRARDADTGNNAVIRYQIIEDATASNKFSMNPEMGTLTVSGQLDYESRDLYTVSVQAFNPAANPAMSSQTTVRVYVTGVNEFPPKFEQLFYRLEVSESASMNSTVTTLRATDQDKGADGVVYYYLVGNSNLRGFALDPLSGQLRVVQRPDYEASPTIVLTAIAKNWGSVQGNDVDTCVINITVQDANDPPQFSKEQYLAQIPEESKRDTFVIAVSAVDNDIRPENRDFTYRLLDTGHDGRFAIDARSGRVVTTGLGVLDRETVSQYELRVLAVDSGSPPQTGSCAVTVYLLDINDNGPVFAPPNLQAYVMEGRPAGTHVITLERNTTDPDVSPNQGPYLYVPLPSSALAYFNIQNRTGEVTTRMELKRENNSRFEVPLIVYDRNGEGPDKMSSTLTFTIIVTDINNSPPQVRPMTVSLMVLQGLSPLGVIADVRPLDDDLQGNYTCRIASGPSSLFAISSGCALRLWFEPDLEAVNYTLSVTGSDGSFEEVTYPVTVQLRRFPRAVLGNAVAVMLDSITALTFLENKYTAFRAAVQSLFPNREPLVLSLMPRGADLHVYLAVRDGDSSVGQALLAQKLSEAEALIESWAGVRVKDPAVRLCNVNPCLNGGTCLTSVTLSTGLVTYDSPHLVLTSPTPAVSESCLCPPAYGGPRCETAQLPCGDGFCSNGGTCTNTTCSCPPEWTGRYCTEDVDECRVASPPCKNGGVCSNTNGSFTCRCPEPYYGPTCESQYQCVSQPCRNGATCVDEQNGFQCQCRFGYYGEVCENSSLGFQEGAFLTLQPIQDYSALTVTGFLATVSRNALVLFNPVLIDGEFEGYVVLEVVDGVAALAFNLAGRSARPVRVEVNGTKVNTGHWYRLEARLQAQLAYLVVQQCSDDGRTCESCDHQNPACYRSVTFSPITSKIQGVRLNVGGVEDFSTILRLNGDVLSHGLVGCLHSLQLSGRNLLDVGLAVNYSSLSDRCPRQQAASLCNATSCSASAAGAGQCYDRWAYAECICAEGWSGKSCESKWQPFGFGSNAKVSFKTKESYRRDRLLLAASGQSQRRRRREALVTSSLLLRVRTTLTTGLLYSARTSGGSCALWLEEGSVKFAYSVWPAADTLTLTLELADGAWHNVTVSRMGEAVVLAVDGLQTVAHNLTGVSSVAYEFPFDSLDVLTTSLGGSGPLPDGRSIKGFEGCLSEVRINGEKLPLNGSSDRYDVASSGSLALGCAALCQSNPCGDGHACQPEGEAYNCSVVAVAAARGLEPGIIVVIVFFSILIVLIVVLFVLFRVRRGWFHRCLPVKGIEGHGSRKNASGANGLNGGSVMGGGSGSKLMGSSQNSLHSRASSGRYLDGNSQLMEEMIIRNHIATELGTDLAGGQKTSSLTSTRPDLIGSGPTTFGDGTMIIENIDQSDSGHVLGMIADEDMPEHYDLENASSIAASDADVIQHYQRYRYGNDLKAHLHHHGRDRYNPNLGLHFKENAHLRQSPVSMTGSALSMPARNSPLVVPGLAGRPASALAALHSPPNRDSPRSRTSPLALSPAQGSSSAHSLGSHHSHSSSSSNNPPQVNGHLPHKGKGVKGGKGGKVYQRGLTVDEVNRLNARADLKNPPSLLEAVSSSSDGPRLPPLHPLQQRPLPPHPSAHLHHHQRLRAGDGAHLENNILLEAPDSSSSDSGANDSFTCSEFEYESTDRVGARGRDPPGAMIFSKLPGIEEDDLLHRPHNDGRNSNGDSAGSNVSDEDRSAGSPSLPFRAVGGGGVFDFDSFLSIGPNFDKLVGVFKDIALLPDSGHAPEGTSTNDYEEYV